MWSDEARQAAADARKGSGVQKDFGHRQHVPSPPAHQSRITKLVSEFGKSESGSGKIPKALEEFHLSEKDPAHASSTLGHVGAAFAEGKLDLEALVHLAHFLGMLACIAVADVIIQWVIHVV